MITPDHTIRTKNWPLIAPAPDGGKLSDFRAAAREVASEFIDHYKAYFARNNARAGNSKTMLDPAPRVFRRPVPGIAGGVP